LRTAPVLPTGALVRSGRGALAHEIVFSDQLLDTGQIPAPAASDCDAQHRRTALVTV
jgi:hypothetical protein